MIINTAIPQSSIAAGVGIKVEAQNLNNQNILFLPQRIAVFGQGNTISVYDTTKRQVSSAYEAATIYGFGSPIHLSVLQLLPVNGDGVGTIPVTIYPLEDGGNALPAIGSIVPTGTQTEIASYTVIVNNISSEAFIINVGDTVATIITSITTAINAVLEMPIIAEDATPGSSTEVGITAKWSGSNTNEIDLNIVSSTDGGTIFVITQPTGGAGVSDIDDALAQVGDVWETLFLNCLDISSEPSLNKFSDFGEGRWNPMVNKPMIAFVGNTSASVASATSVTDNRKTDRVNAQLVAPSSKDLSFIVAARQLARIAVVANGNPPKGYVGQKATGLVPGDDGVQWTYAQRDEAVKKGSSTIVVKDGVINISDVITFYHPSGEEVPPYRKVVNIIKLQTALYNLQLIFDAPEWASAPLIADDQFTTNSAARQPKAAVAEISSMLDSLGLNAIISDPDTAKANTFAEIDSQNPDRLNASTIVQLSGNSDVVSVVLGFGFFFGTPTVVV